MCFAVVRLSFAGQLPAAHLVDNLCWQEKTTLRIVSRCMWVIVVQIIVPRHVLAKLLLRLASAVTRSAPQSVVSNIAVVNVSLAGQWPVTSWIYTLCW